MPWSSCFASVLVLLAAVGSSVAEEEPPLSPDKIVEFVDKSVVVVEVTSQEGHALGSGFVLDHRLTPNAKPDANSLVDKYAVVVTNYHVIDGALSARVKFGRNTSVDADGYLGISVGKDLAIIRCRLPDEPVPQPLPLADAQPRRGEAVYAFGAPEGFEASVSSGIVSAVRNAADIRTNLLTITGVDVYCQQLKYDLDAVWIQTTTPISQGNSGGPLVNARGEVVGLNTWSDTRGQNLNFAISGEHIRSLYASADKLHPFSELPRRVIPAPDPKPSPGAPRAPAVYRLPWGTLDLNTIGDSRNLRSKMGKVPFEARFTNGNLASQCGWSDKRHNRKGIVFEGAVLTNYESGAKQLIGHYTEGDRNGACTLWDENGSLKFSGFYKRHPSGKSLLDGTITVFRTGQPSAALHYHNGKVTEVCEFVGGEFVLIDEKSEHGKGALKLASEQRKTCEGEIAAIERALGAVLRDAYMEALKKQASIANAQKRRARTARMAAERAAEEKASLVIYAAGVAAGF